MTVSYSLKPSYEHVISNLSKYPVQKVSMKIGLEKSQMALTEGKLIWLIWKELQEVSAGYQQFTIYHCKT